MLTAVSKRELLLNHGGDFRGGKIRKWSEHWENNRFNSPGNCADVFELLLAVFFFKCVLLKFATKKLNWSIGMWYLWGIFGWSQGKCAIIKCSSSGKANQATVMMPHMVFSCSTPWWDVHINYELLPSGRRDRVPVKKIRNNIWTGTNSHSFHYQLPCWTLGAVSRGFLYHNVIYLWL